RVRGSGRSDELIRHLPAGEADLLYKQHGDKLPQELRSKLEQAVRAVRDEVPRVHFIDGRVELGLLAEVFSNEGIGTLIHANEYEAIRRANRHDARAIHTLIQAGVERDDLVQRSAADIE